MHTKTLLTAFCELEDPRSLRGIRHPFSGIVVLTLPGCPAHPFSRKTRFYLLLRKLSPELAGVSFRPDG